MSNMSYCRFQNTLSDLADCHNALGEIFDADHGKLSEDELHAARRLIETCGEILQLVAEHGLGVDVDNLDDILKSVKGTLAAANNANSNDE
jgi:hypothetical protein